VLLLGVDYNSCTFFHCVEYALPVPYLGMTPKPDAWIRLPSGKMVPAGCRIHRPRKRYDFNRVALTLDKEGLTRTVTCGRAILRLFSAAPVFDRVFRALQQDPLVLVQHGASRLEVPVEADA
jgi:aminoglycoside N3'-acetyltransferase